MSAQRSTHREVHAHVLVALHRMPVFRGREEPPAVQGVKQDLIEPWILRGLDQFDFHAAVSMDFEVRDGHELITLFAQIVGKHGQRLRDHACLRGARCDRRRR